MNQVPPGMDMLVTPDRSTALSVPCRPDGGELGTGGAPCDIQSRHVRLAERQVTVAFDETWHYPLAGSVYRFNVLSIFDVDFRWNCTHTEDAVALQDHRVVL